MSPLLWISRSLEHVTEALRGIGYALSTFVVRWTLKSLGYRLQANRKTHEGGKHPDRNAQFLYIPRLIEESGKSLRLAQGWIRMAA